MVEDLSTGRWGGTYATVIGDVDGDLAEMMLPLPRVIHLLEPEDQMVIGPTLFQVVHDPEVRRVDFYMDGELEARLTSPPFATRLDLGRLPEPHRVEVVAFDAGGRELGRDRLSLNESGGLFRVRIVTPCALPARRSLGRRREPSNPAFLSYYRKVLFKQVAVGFLADVENVIDGVEGQHFLGELACIFRIQKANHALYGRDCL